MTRRRAAAPRGISGREHNMLEAVRRHFHRTGGSPSLADLGTAIGMRREEVGRVLRRLEQLGLITRQPGVARSIVLISRAANLSDVEIEMEARTRGYHIERTTISDALAGAFSAPVTEAAGAPADMLDLIAQIDAKT